MLKKILIPALCLLTNSPVFAATAPLPVPEPETHSMILLGIAFIGAIVVRRNKGD